MHTKPISTEVIASYEATLTSGFALTFENGEFCFQPGDTIPPLDEFREKMVNLLNQSDSLEVSHVTSRDDVLSLLKKIPGFIKHDVTPYYVASLGMSAKLPSQCKVDLSGEKAVTQLLFDTVLYLSDEDFRIRSIMEELVNRLTTENKNGAIDESTMEKFQELLQLDNGSSPSPYNWKSVTLTPFDQVVKSEFYEQLNRSMIEQSLNEEPKLKLHQHMLPSLLVVKDDQDVEKSPDVVTNLLCAKQFYETLKKAQSQAEEASRLTVADDSSEDQHEDQKAVTDYLKAIDQLFEPLNTEKQVLPVDVKSNGIYRSLRDYHFALYRFAAISGCSRLVGCVNETIANKQYEHILRFESFVKAFPEINPPGENTPSENWLLSTLRSCMVKSKELIETVTSRAELRGLEIKKT